MGNTAEAGMARSVDTEPYSETSEFGRVLVVGGTGRLGTLLRRAWLRSRQGGLVWQRRSGDGHGPRFDPLQDPDGFVAAASGVTVEFMLKASAFHPDLTAYCDAFGLKPETQVLSGGEDYELLFACLPETFEQIKTRLPGAFQVGKCLEFSGQLFANLPKGIQSFQHGNRSVRKP